MYFNFLENYTNLWLLTFIQVHIFLLWRLRIEEGD